MVGFVGGERGEGREGESDIPQGFVNCANWGG